MREKVELQLKMSQDFKNVRNRQFAGRSFNLEHTSAPLSQSVVQHAIKDGGSVMKAGCCGADQRAPISSLGSFLAPDP